MSLINEALRKARLEAARNEVAQKGIPYPALRRRAPSSSLSRYLLGGALLALTLAGAGFFWLGLSWGREEVLVTAVAAERQPATDLPSPAAATVEAPSVQSSPGPPTAANRAVPSESQSRLEPGSEDPASTEPVAPGPAVDVPTIERPTLQQAPTDSKRLDTRRQELAAGAQNPQVAPRRDSPPARPVASGVAAPTASDEGGRSERDRPQPPSKTRSRESRRDPLARQETVSPGAQSEPRSFVGEATVAGATVKLGGIAWSRERPFALINGRVVGQGDLVEGLLIETVDPRQVLLRTNGGELLILRLE